MRNAIQKYLADAQHEANQVHMSADGRHYGADGFIDQHYFTNDLNPSEFFPQDGGPGTAAPAQAQTLSQPYMIQISNASASNVQGVDIWWANQYLGAGLAGTGTRSNGSLTVNGVTISSIMPDPNITYYNMLQQSLTNNFTIGKTYLAAISGPNPQVQQPLSIYTQDSNGNFAGKTLPSPLSPFQYQAGVLENNFPYRIDGNTAVRITVLASAVFQMWFYPSYTINLARALGDKAIGREYKAPLITPPQTVKAIG